jgi:hypothetical protein
LVAQDPSININGKPTKPAFSAMVRPMENTITTPAAPL